MNFKKTKGFISFFLIAVTVLLVFAGCGKNGDDTYECQTADGTITFYRHELTEEEKKTTEPKGEMTTVAGGTETTQSKQDKAEYLYYYIENDEKIYLDSATYRDSEGTLYVLSMGFVKDYIKAYEVLRIVLIVLAVVLVVGGIFLIAYKGVKHEEKEKKASRQKGTQNNKK